MTLQRFQCLSRQAQQDTVKHLGVLLCERQSLDLTVYLYQLADFYTEVFYMAENDRILTIRSFQDTDLLTPYLSSIDITEIRNLLA